MKYDENKSAKARLPWLGLVALMVLFLILVVHIRPTDRFGAYRDDATYFSSAKALAEGRGYILASLPGNPHQTKYPVLYPWLLSWIWRLSPSFPANLKWGVCLTAIFGCGFLALAFVLVRMLRGGGDGPALAIVALCACLPDFVMVGGSVLSDSLYMFLVLAAALLADVAVRAEKRLPLSILAGGLAGLSIMARSVGVAAVAGIVLTGLHRRAFRQAFAACIGAVPFALLALWVSGRWLAGGRVTPLQITNLAPGWQQTYIYYTSYLGMWKICVPNITMFLTMVRGNLGAILETPAWYWLHPTLGTGTSLTATALGTPLTLIGLAGMVRQARSDEWKPIHFVLGPTLLILLLWNYPVTDRFLLVFLPLFCLGFWVEGKRLSAVLWRALARGGIPERILAGLIASGFVALGGIAAWNTWQFYRPHPYAELQAARLRIDKAQAYGWLQKNTTPDDRIIACEDSRVYLFTGRETVMPIAFSSEHGYTHDPQILERDLSRMADTAIAVHAHYWLTSPDDFSTDDERAEPARMREAKITAPFPEVFRSPDGRVQVRDVSGLTQSNQGR